LKIAITGRNPEPLRFVGSCQSPESIGPSLVVTGENHQSLVDASRVSRTPKFFIKAAEFQ
jgi:hypothetical protein